MLNSNKRRHQKNFKNVVLKIFTRFAAENYIIYIYTFKLAPNYNMLLDYSFFIFWGYFVLHKINNFDLQHRNFDDIFFSNLHISLRSCELRPLTAWEYIIYKTFFKCKFKAKLHKLLLCLLR